MSKGNEWEKSCVTVSAGGQRCLSTRVRHYKLKSFGWFSDKCQSAQLVLAQGGPLPSSPSSPPASQKKGQSLQQGPSLMICPLPSDLSQLGHLGLGCFLQMLVTSSRWGDERSRSLPPQSLPQLVNHCVSDRPLIHDSCPIGLAGPWK